MPWLISWPRKKLIELYLLNRSFLWLRNLRNPMSGSLV